MKKYVSLVLLSLLIFPTLASAYGKRTIGRTSARRGVTTAGTFIDQQVWLPGTWVVGTQTGSLTFSRRSPDGKRDELVKIVRIPRTECGYGIVRMRALKAWGGKALEQSQGRIQPISFGTSKYKGYTWMEPSTWDGDRHWCLAQDLTGAMDLSAPEGDRALLEFVTSDLLLQLAVRRGRSVLPWPMASEHPSTQKK